MQSCFLKISKDCYHLKDHGGGFDQFLRNGYLDQIADINCDVITEYVIHNHNENYKNLNFLFDVKFKKKLFASLIDYKTHPELNFRKFICSFNGSVHTSRKLLVSNLEKLRWFDSETCSKNFSYTVDILDGHLSDYLNQDQCRFFRKFFIGENSDVFFQTQHSFGHDRYDHRKNISNLENQLTSSFLHIVSETMATSYYPFVTEKFLYSIVTRGLFVAYAQPGWHDHLERYYGFRKYEKIFDYRFDAIKNPIERLVELTSMMSKFSVLSSDDWRDLYEMEIDTIEYNHDHYFSGTYMKHLETHTCG